MIHETSHEAGQPSPRPSAEEIRAELYQMIDEIAMSRTVNTARLPARFAELWRQLGPDTGPTVH